MRRIYASLLIILAITIGGPAPRAQAWYCGPMPCEPTTPWLFATGGAITSFTLALVAELYTNLRNGYSAFNAQLQSNTTSYTEELSYHSQAVAEVRRQVEAHRVAQSTQAPPTYAPQATATSAAAGASLQTRLARESIHNQNFLFTRNMDKLTQGSPSVNSIRLLDNHLTKYCGELEHSMGLCEKNTQKPRLIDADIRASTVFEEDTIEAELEGAAVDYAAMVAGPPPPKPGKNDLKNSAGIQKVQQRNIRDARASLAYETMDWLVAFRTEIPDDQLKDWAKAMVKKLTGGVGMAASYNGHYFGQPCGGSGSAGFLDVVINGDICKPFKAGMIIHAGQGATDIPIIQAQADLLNVYYSSLKAQGFTTTGAIAWTLHVYAEILKDTSSINSNSDWVNSIGCLGTGQFCGVRPYNYYDADGLYLVGGGSWPGLTNPFTGKKWEPCDLVPSFVNMRGLQGCGGTIVDVMQHSAVAYVQILRYRPGEFGQYLHDATTPGVSSSTINYGSTFGVIRNGSKGEMQARVNGFNQTFAENKAAFEAGAADCTGKQNGTSVTDPKSTTPPAPGTSTTPTTPANTTVQPPATQPIPTPTPTPAPTSQPTMTGKYLLMRSSGKKDQYGGVLYDLSYMDGQAVKGTIQIVSGRPGRTSADQNVPNEGPLPGGKWDIGAVDTSPQECDVGSIWIPLSPQSGTNTYGRSAFGIHRDNDRTTTYPGTKCVSPYSPHPGTAGCVGTLDQSGIETVKGWVQDGAKVLVVDYNNTAGSGTQQNCTGVQNPIYDLFSGGLPTKVGLSDTTRHWAGTGGYCAVAYSGPPDRNGNPHCYIGGVKIVTDIVGKLHGRADALDTPTPSPADGTVIHYQYDDVAGNNIKIQTADGTTVRVLHFNRMQPGIQVGSQVKFGQIVGFEGMTGGTSTGVHWHSEMPIAYINRWIKALATGMWDGACLDLTGGGGGTVSTTCSSPTADLGINELADRTSHAELIKLISTYRFMDPEWIDFVTNSASPFQLLRDIATMHSISLYNDWQRYTLKQKVAAMLSGEDSAEQDITKIVQDDANLEDYPHD